MSVHPEKLSPEAVEKRINKIAEVTWVVVSHFNPKPNSQPQGLAHGDPGPSESLVELRELCGAHHTVPRLYKLEGVTKEGDHPYRTSRAAEIWKGRYDDKAVALKILRLPRGDPRVLKTKSVSTSHAPKEGSSSLSDG